MALIVYLWLYVDRVIDEQRLTVSQCQSVQNNPVEMGHAERLFKRNPRVLLEVQWNFPTPVKSPPNRPPPHESLKGAIRSSAAAAASDTWQ